MNTLLVGTQTVTKLVEDGSSRMVALWYHNVMASGLVQTKLSRTVIVFYEWDVGLIINPLTISFNVG
eukprot:SAG31_NODE_505_length_14757_cov_20.172943_16_plen_67_part_00